MIKIRHPIIDPVSQKSTDPLTLFTKIYATVCLQRFYRNQIKCLRDETGLPIDPILKEGFPRHNMVRIIYKSKIASTNKTNTTTASHNNNNNNNNNSNSNNNNSNGNSNSNHNKYISRLQVFDIASLWQSLQHSNGCLNPITNTYFTDEQARQIGKKAVEVGLVNAHTMESTLSKWGHKHNSDQMSAYEINNTHAKETIKNTRLHNLLPYFALMNDLPRVEALLYSNMENASFNISYGRKSNTILPKWIDPENKKKNVLKILLKCIHFMHSNSMNHSNNSTTTSTTSTTSSSIGTSSTTTSSAISITTNTTNSGTKNTVTKTNTISKDLDPLTDQEFQLDTLLEKSLLPNYLTSYNAIQASCIRGNRDMLAILLQFGAQVDLPNISITPLHIALYEKKIDLVHVLMLYGANSLLEKDSSIGTPLEIASTHLEEFPDIYSVLFNEDIMLHTNIENNKQIIQKSKTNPAKTAFMEKIINEPVYPKIDTEQESGSESDSGSESESDLPGLVESKTPSSDPVPMDQDPIINHWNPTTSILINNNAPINVSNNNTLINGSNNKEQFCVHGCGYECGHYCEETGCSGKCGYEQIIQCSYNDHIMLLDHFVRNDPIIHMYSIDQCIKLPTLLVHDHCNALAMCDYLILLYICHLD